MTTQLPSKIYLCLPLRSMRDNAWRVQANGPLTPPKLVCFHVDRRSFPTRLRIIPASEWAYHPERTGNVGRSKWSIDHSPHYF